MGDIYVYPTRLDGLGLTMYEALASGMPMIVSDFPPMNEVGTSEFVKYVKIADYYCRGDAYYYPMVKCDENSLIEAMKWYVNHPDDLKKQKLLARTYAEQYYDIAKLSSVISNIFIKAVNRPLDSMIVLEVKRSYLKKFNVLRWILNHRIIDNLRHRK